MLSNDFQPDPLLLSHPTGSLTTLTIEDVLPNRLPIAQTDIAVIKYGSSIVIPVLDNDSDPDGDPLTLVSVYSPWWMGSASIVDNKIHLKSPPLHVLPPYTQSIDYSISDGKGGIVKAQVMLTLVDDIARGDLLTVQGSKPVSLSVLLNNDAIGNGLSIVKVNDPINGTITQQTDGTYIYTASLTSWSDHFTYVAEGNGYVSEPTNVYVRVENSAPFISFPGTLTVAAGETISALGLIQQGANRASFQDPEGDPVTIRILGEPNVGTVTQLADGTYTYTAKKAFEGVDRFTYLLADSRGSFSNVVEASVVVTNDKPIVNPDSFTVIAGQPTVLPVLANDADFEGYIPVINFSSPSHGTLVRESNGTLTYTASSNFSGIDTFDYGTVYKGLYNPERAMVTLTVKPPDRLPVGVPDQGRVFAGESITIPVLANDYDPDETPVRLYNYSQPQQGNLQQNSDGTLIYTARSGFTGTDSFSYSIVSGSLVSQPIPVTVIIPDRPPIGNPDNASVLSGGSVTIPVLANDISLDGTPLELAVNFLPDYGTVKQASDGSLIYTANKNFSGLDHLGYAPANQGVRGNTVPVEIAVHGSELKITPGNDILGGNDANNAINGGGGSDRIEGNNGNDQLSGSAGDDILNGGSGDDVLNGDSEHDILLGNLGSDRLNGGSQHDWLIGGAGSDQLIGGTGNDRFIYTDLTDAGDTITDFGNGMDILDLSNLFNSLNYRGSDPVADGYLQLVSQGGKTIVNIDADAMVETTNFVTLVTLNGVLPTAFVVGQNLLI